MAIKSTKMHEKVLEYRFDCAKHHHLSTRVFRAFLCLFVACVIVFVATCAKTGIAAEIVALRERVAMSTPVVRLGDVAEIQSADPQRARQLAALLLMPAPAPGSEQFLRRREVEDLLVAHGQDLRELRVEGAQQIAISGAASESSRAGDIAFSASSDSAPMNLHAAILAGQTGHSNDGPLDQATASALQNQLLRAIESYLSEKTGKTEAWQVSCNVAGGLLAQLRDATSPVVCQGGREPRTGRQRFTLSFTTPQGTMQVPIYAQVSGGPVMVAVAVRPIARGAMITGADVELQILEASPATTSRRSPFNSLDQFVGMEARQAIQPGETIFTDQVQAPILVKRGELITVVSQGGGIRVRTTALAREDGAKGDLVKVEAEETGERFDARVIGPREAAVFVGGTNRPDLTKPLETWMTAPRMPQPPGSTASSAPIGTTRR
jgi:flagella basal body P-ring formation protein FlgA